MIKNIIVVALVTISFSSTQAQYVEDAYRFSNNTLNGTARILGMGGAQTALGADLSSISGNPAGLGFYRSNDYSVSPNMRFNNLENNVFGKLNSNNHTNFNLGNFGFVLTQMNQDYTGREVSNGWVSFHFGLSNNRTNSFKENSYFSGVNDQSTFSSYLAASANNYYGSTALPDTNINSIYDMAWYGYMIDFDTTLNKYVPIANNATTQMQSSKSGGYEDQVNISFGANYSNKLYLGASIGLGSIEYSKQSTFKESNINDPLYNVSEIKLKESLFVSGTSLNFKLGGIYRPIDLIRFGLSLQTPNYYTFNENFTTDLSSVKNGVTQSFTPLEYLFDYKLATPMRINYGTAIFFGKTALISLDLEQLNYSAMRLDAVSGNEDFGPDNNSRIQNTFQQNTYNLRLGAETKLDGITLRAGYAHYGDAYKSAAIDQSKKSITAGLGYRTGDAYVDFAFVQTSYESAFYPYYAANINNPVVNSSNTIKSFTLTIGSRF